VLTATLGGAVSFGCGPVSSSSGATTVVASFDATGTVVYSRVVSILGGGFGHAGPVADGLGGVSWALQQEIGGEGGNILVTRFAP
jgi:hypothetical protein